MSQSDNYETPALPAPYGTISHITTHSPEQAWYYAGGAPCTIVSVLLLILRLYTKTWMVRRVDATDCLSLPL